MKNKVPAYIIKDLEKLSKHLDAVAELAGNIESWVEKNTSKDSLDFFYENHLDMPYEFNLDYTKAELERIVDGNLLARVARLNRSSLNAALFFVWCAV